MYRNIIIAILVIIVFLFIKDKATYIGEPSVIIDTVYKTDTFKVYKKGKNIPFVVLDTTYLIDEIHDTIKVLLDYSKVYAYSDTIKLDSLGWAYIHDTVSQNKIQSRGFKAEIKQKTIFITKTIPNKDKNQLYLGFIGDLRRLDEKVGIGLGLGFYSPKMGLFTLSATTNQYSLSYLVKL